MIKKFNPEDPSEMDKWIREYFQIKADEATDIYLVRTGVTEDTPQGFVKRMSMAAAWLWPQLTPRTRPIYDEMWSIIEDYNRKTSPIQDYIPGQEFTEQEEPTEADQERCLRAMMLFEQAKELHRVESSLASQEAFQQAQRARASKPRKLDETACSRIAKLYWESKAEGSSYGVAKMLAAEYDVSTTTIHNTAKKYKNIQLISSRAD